MAKKDVQVNVRLPADLLEMLRAASDRAERSLTAEITARLYDSFPQSLREVRLNEVVNALYVAQSLEYRIQLSLQSATAGSRQEAERRDELRAVRLHIRELKDRRDKLISVYESARKSR